MVGLNTHIHPPENKKKDNNSEIKERPNYLQYGRRSDPYQGRNMRIVLDDQRYHALVVFSKIWKHGFPKSSKRTRHTYPTKKRLLH